MSGKLNPEQLNPDVTADSSANVIAVTSPLPSEAGGRRRAQSSSHEVHDDNFSPDKTITGQIPQTSPISETENISASNLPANQTNILPFNMADTLSHAQLEKIIENATSQSYVLSLPSFSSSSLAFPTAAPPYLEEQNTGNVTALHNDQLTPAVSPPPANGQYFTRDFTPSDDNHDAYRYTFIPHATYPDTTSAYASSSTPTHTHSYPPAIGVHQEFSVNDLRMVATKKASPKTGWRKGIYLLSGATINLGPSAKERYQKSLRSVITKPLDKNYQISVLSMKGGVGKTTISFILGSVLATMRSDNIIALDANPDFGTLAHRTEIHNEGNVRDLINDHRIIERSDINTYTNTTETGLEILNSEIGNSESDGLTLAEYRNVMQKLGPFYRMVLTDCGTGIHHPSVQGSLEAAHVVIIPTVPSIDSARSTIATMDWLEKKGYGALLKNSIILINSLRFGSTNIDIEQLRTQFEPRVRAVHCIPYDPHIAEGGLLDLQQLHKSTLKAFIELAALVVENFY